MIRGEPPADRDPHATLVLEATPDLDRVLPEARLTDDLGATVLLERRGDDLGRGRRSAVDEDGDRQVRVRRDAVTGRRVFLHVPVRGLLGEDQAVVDELAGDLLRGVDIPAGVVAEIEDDLVGALVEQLLEPGPELVGGRGEKPWSAM